MFIIITLSEVILLSTLILGAVFPYRFKDHYISGEQSMANNAAKVVRVVQLNAFRSDRGSQELICNSVQAHEYRCRGPDLMA